MKLKKIYIIIIAMITCLFVAPYLVDAIDNGGGTGGGGSTGNGVGSGYCSPGFLCNYGKAGDTGAFKVSLVYKDKNKSTYDVIKTVVVQNNSLKKCATMCGGLQRKIEEYAKSHNYKILNSGALASLVGEIRDGGLTFEQRFPKGLTTNSEIKQYINDLGVKVNQLQKPQDKNPGTFNSFGYRILFEKLTIWMGNYGVSNGIVTTRREFVETGKNGNLCGNYAGCSYEIYTIRDDIGITKSPAATGRSVDSVTKNKNSYGVNKGHGYRILWFSTEQFQNNYDYSIDAACVGCDVKGLDNRAMIIQDTTDWEAIMNSRTQTLVKSAQNYYYGSDSGSYCREEYRVKLPDSSKEITVKPGKYLTVGALKKELEKLTKGTANVGPIEVTKIIQCKGGDLNKRRTVNEQNYFVSASKHKSLGTITLQYEECGDNRKYNGKIELVPNLKEGVPSVNSSISVDDDGKEMLTQSQTVSYTLPSNTYRYVRNQDGLSIKSLSSIKANDLNTKYRDLGFSTLPISFDNEGDSVKVKANLHFEYTLPEHKTHKTDGGAYSAIKEAYGTKNYFKSSGNAVDNVYKKYTKGDAKAKTQINKSACNKLYGTTNQACINSHVNDKTADCKNINKISSDKTGSCEKAYSQNGYVCPVKIPPIPACPPGECPPEDPPCENGRPRCADGTCPVDGEECKPCEDDLCTDVPGIDVIYRPIDLANPFPGQKGSKTKSRKTGANWCEYNQKTGKLNCSANNAVSKKYIINKKVYNDNHVLYKVTLDANTISKVRNYNKNKKYDDFDLKCKDGKACISDFLNNVINVEGKCSKVNHGNFYTCNK